MSALQPLNALGMPLAGTQLIEASAGTGKTWTIAALYVRLVLGHGRDAPLLPNQILVMTFTKAATAELRERIRSRLTEAAAAFRSDGTGDDFLRDLVAHYPAGNARAGAARRLDLAAQWMDEAAIFTIHGWCQRMLTQHAFASGDTVADGGIADAAALRIEAVRDYWRCCVAPLADDGVAWVAQWWQSPDDLAAAVKPLLPLPVAGLRLGDAGIPPIADASAFIATRAAALHAASATARTAWRDDADTIDALLTNAVQARTLSATKLPLTSLPGCLAAMRDWASGADAPVELLRRFTQPAIDGAANKGKAAPGHPAFAALQRLVEAGAAGTVDYPRLLAHAAHWIAAHEDAARRAQGTLGYDDMLQRLANALDDDHGEALAQRIVAQYPVALVDEFQDTDPLQWHSLERVYVDRPGATLCLIGDPKQAIYGFRGADIQTYLHARERAALPWWTLPVNFRSTTALVAAVNRVFLHASTQPQGAFGFDDQLRFQPVTARGRGRALVLDGTPLPAMQLAQLPSDQVPSTGAWRDAMAAHAAAQIVAWLEAAQAGRCGFADADAAFEPLAPGDIAILVRDKDDAAAMRTALHQRGLAHVYLSDRQSVYASAEAGDLLYWLAACAQPGADGALRTALATPSMARSRAELERLNVDETYREACDDHFHALHAQWQQHGVLAMVHELLHRFGVPQRLLATPTGERALTNLLHLAELLQQAAAALDGDRALIRFLAGQIADPASGEDADAQIVRLESEAALIKVVTVHKSKGLEYPVVLLPFACGFREPRHKGVAAARDEHDHRQIDLAPGPETWAAVERERRQEDLRLLYVALTRAQYMCWLGVANLKYGNGGESQLHKSAFGYVLGGGAPIAAQDLPARLDALRGGHHDIAISRLPEVAGTDVIHQAGAPPPARSARRCTLPPAEAWWIASYSALAHTGTLPASPIAPETAVQATLVEPGARPDTMADGLDAQGIHAFPRGAAPGTFLHELLEHCAHAGFSAIAAKPAALRDAVARRCANRGWQKWVEPLAQWLQQLLQTPLPLPGGEPLPLQALTPPSRYRAELEFWFEAHQVDTLSLDELITAQTLHAAPRPALARNAVNGMLNGFIDLVFEHAGRWYVIDYKSNWLGANAAAYTPEAMRASVLHSRYDLQYAIYTLALHRQLQARLPDYDYDRHMGGVMYLYLRGIDDAGHGVHVERLPRTLIETLDARFAGRATLEPAT